MTAEERIRKLEKKLSEIYRVAEKEMRGKWDEYMSRQEKRAETLLSRIRESKTDEERKAAEAKYRDFLKSKTFGEKYYRDMVEELARKYSGANEQAIRMVNGERFGAFAEGYNLSADGINEATISEDVGIRFDLCDENAVKYLVDHGNDLLVPTPKYLDWTADMIWNVKNINSQVTQGIVQGESIPKIAARLHNVTGLNKASAVRTARTMVTGCENAGRVQAMERAAEWGVKTRKRWLCTHDHRTRDSHLRIDGETVDEDAEFSNGCRWPGDPIGPGAEVYNCRCTLITVVDGFSSNLPRGHENTVRIWIGGERVK